jgi:hypothetical protein
MSTRVYQPKRQLIPMRVCQVTFFSDPVGRSRPPSELISGTTTRPGPGMVVNRPHTRTRLCRQSNQSFVGTGIPAGKRFSKAGDWARIFRDDCLFRAAETGLSRVSPAEAPGS